MCSFYDFTLQIGFNDAITEIPCRMAYTVSRGYRQTLTQPAEDATLDVKWVKQVMDPTYVAPMSKIADFVYDCCCDEIEAAAMSAHKSDERDDQMDAA